MPPPAPARPGLWHEAPREARRFCLVTQGLTVEWVLGQSPCRPGTGAEQGPRVRGGRWEGPEDTPPTSAAPEGLGDTTSGRGQQGAEVQTPQAEVRWDGAPSWRWRPAPQALPVGSVGGQRRAGPIGSGGAEPNVRARAPRPQELAAHAAGIRGGARPPRRSGDRGVASGRYPTETQGVCGLGCGRAWLYQPGRSQRRLLPGQSHRPRLPLGQPRGEGTAPGGAWGPAPPICGMTQKTTCPVGPE